jgi:hypothetical protein
MLRETVSEFGIEYFFANRKTPARAGHSNARETIVRSQQVAGHFQVFSGM